MKTVRLFDGDWHSIFLLPDGRQARVVGKSRTLVEQQADYWRRWAVLERIRVKVKNRRER